MLKGKIHWIQDDFNYDGLFKVKLDSKSSKTSFKESEHVTTKLENVIIDEFVIKFSTVPYDSDGEIFSYNLNLTSLEQEFLYKGFASSETDPEMPIEVKCELFENKKHYFIYGSWVEYDTPYTWWAIIDKQKK